MKLSGRVMYFYSAVKPGPVVVGYVLMTLGL